MLRVYIVFTVFSFSFQVSKSDTGFNQVVSISWVHGVAYKRAMLETKIVLLFVKLEAKESAIERKHSCTCTYD